MNKPRSALVLLFGVGMAPVFAAEILPPAIHTVEEGGAIHFSTAPMAGVTLPAVAGAPHECGDYYPAMAERMHRTGSALMQFTIQPDGRISGQKITQSTGHPELDESGLKCVENWTYRPAFQNGKPVPALNTVQVTWQIKSWPDPRER